MITIVEEKTHYNDKRTIIAISAKIKSENEKIVQDPLVATVMAAICKTTLPADEKSVGISVSLDHKRNYVADMKIKLQRETLTRIDVANFFGALQKAIDETKLF